MNCPSISLEPHPQTAAEREQLARFEVHAAGCHRCGRRLRALRRLDRLVGELAVDVGEEAGSCPSPDVVLDWVYGARDPTPFMEEHLVACADCRADVLLAAKYQDDEGAPALPSSRRFSFPSESSLDLVPAPREQVRRRLLSSRRQRILSSGRREAVPGGRPSKRTPSRRQRTPGDSRSPSWRQRALSASQRHRAIVMQGVHPIAAAAAMLLAAGLTYGAVRTAQGPEASAVQAQAPAPAALAEVTPGEAPVPAEPQVERPQVERPRAERPQSREPLDRSAPLVWEDEADREPPASSQPRARGAGEGADEILFPEDAILPEDEAPAAEAAATDRPAPAGPRPTRVAPTQPEDPDAQDADAQDAGAQDAGEAEAPRPVEVQQPALALVGLDVRGAWGLQALYPGESRWQALTAGRLPANTSLRASTVGGELLLSEGSVLLGPSARASYEDQVALHAGQAYVEAVELTLAHTSCSVVIDGAALLEARRDRLAMASLSGNLRCQDPSGRETLLGAGQRMRASQGGLSAPQAIPGAAAGKLPPWIEPLRPQGGGALDPTQPTGTTGGDDDVDGPVVGGGNGRGGSGPGGQGKGNAGGNTSGGPGNGPGGNNAGGNNAGGLGNGKGNAGGNNAGGLGNGKGNSGGNNAGGLGKGRGNGPGGNAGGVGHGNGHGPAGASGRGNDNRPAGGFRGPVRGPVRGPAGGYRGPATPAGGAVRGPAGRGNGPSNNAAGGRR